MLCHSYLVHFCFLGATFGAAQIVRYTRDTHIAPNAPNIFKTKAYIKYVHVHIIHVIFMYKGFVFSGAFGASYPIN